MARASDMRVFLVHRRDARAAAVRALKRLAARAGIAVTPIVLNSFGGGEWKSAAREGIEDSEAVAVFDLDACNRSKNATWEIHEAEACGKPLIYIDPNGSAGSDSLETLRRIYHHDQEFDSYFDSVGEGVEPLYKLMVDSAESLIQRRQRMNAFFITGIGGLIGLGGALMKFGTLEHPLAVFGISFMLSIAGLLLCNSWYNLIDNYGKLNAAKFRVILKLEQSLQAQVFAAEWAALGKGVRPRKYQSFTATESKVPQCFAFLIFALYGFVIVWFWGRLLQS